MQKLFNKVLIPVDFTERSNVAVEKACDIARQYNCSLHLLHVVPISPFAAMAMTEGPMVIPLLHVQNKVAIENNFNRLISKIKLLNGEQAQVNSTILQGSWDEAIIDFIGQHNIDLVLVGQKEKFLQKRKMFINPDKIADRANVPVITVPSNKRLIKLLSIVIPITDFLPVRKLMYGVYIASGHNSTVKLLGIENDDTHDKVQHYLKKATELIRENSSIKVETETIKSDNVAEAVNQFTRQKPADLLILNPQTQTKMPGFFSQLLGNIIQKYSTPPILTVNPV